MSKSWILLVAGATLFIFLFLMGTLWIFAKRLKTYGCSPKVLFKSFEEKMWITVGLGSFFFSFYSFIVFYCLPFMTKEIFLSLLNYGIDHPTYFFAWGAFYFACNTALIYLIRTIIKYLYLKRRLGL